MYHSLADDRIGAFQPVAILVMQTKALCHPRRYSDHVPACSCKLRGALQVDTCIQHPLDELEIGTIEDI